MPIDYSKWKAIEVSDDEDDTHPNIDTPSLFRWRHQARLERMAETKQKREEIEQAKNKTETKLEQLEKQLQGASLSEQEKMKAELERAVLMKQEEEYKAKEKELEDQERLQPWNVDTIGHEAFSSSRINKVSEKKPERKQTLDEEEETKRMTKYFDDNESLLQQYGRLTDLKATEAFFLEHPILGSDYAANFLTIECLNLAIDNKDAEMCVMARQCILVQYLLELAKSVNGVATNVNIIKNFFKKMRAADPSYMKLYEDEVEQFQDRLRRRAKEKREAAIAEYEAEEKQKRIEASPKGLDPQEVYEGLPDEMRKCFDEQDIPSLQKCAETMDKEVFLYHLNRCVDSGLWVPGASGEDDGDEPTEGEKEKLQSEVESK